MSTNPFARKIVVLCFFTLLLLVLLEYVFIQAKLFKYVPHIGIVFHFVGGIVIAGAALYLFRSAMLFQKRSIQSIFMLGCVALAAICWEGFEWMFSTYFYNNNLQGSLNNTMGDLYVGLIGGVAACLGNYWRPIK